MKDRRSTLFDRILSLIMAAICVIVGIMIIRNFLKPHEAGLGISSVTDQSVINVAIETAEHSDLTSYTKLYGSITTDSDPIAVYPDVSGKVTSITVRRGDRVEKGAIIGYVDKSKPGYTYQESPIEAPASGEVISVDAAAGDTVQESTKIITIRLDEELRIETNVPERYIYALSLGSPSSFTVAAYPDRTYQAELTYISPVVDTSTRTAAIELTITGDETGLMEGMFATVNLAAETAENVITVPESAISEDRNGSYVLVADSGTAVRKTVKEGLSDGTRTAILEGLADGDQVIVSGAAEEGSLISIVEEN